MKKTLFTLLTALLTAAAARAEFFIEKATYGDAARREDVTELLRRKAAGAENEFFALPVSSSSVGRDPAPGKMKYLEIELNIDGTARIMQFDDGSTAYYSAYPPTREFTLRKALWGADGKFLDVTEKVRKALASNRELPVDWKTLGDPLPGKGKYLTVVYSVDNRSKRLVIDREGVRFGADSFPDGDCVKEDR